MVSQCKPPSNKKKTETYGITRFPYAYVLYDHKPQMKSKSHLLLCDHKTTQGHRNINSPDLVMAGRRAVATTPLRKGSKSDGDCELFICVSSV